MSARFEELAWRETPMGEISLRRRREPSLDVDVFEVKLGDEYLMSSLFTVAEIEQWQERLMAAAENALRSRPKDDEALKDEQIRKLKQKVGELVLDVDILREAAKGRPTDPTTSGE